MSKLNKHNREVSKMSKLTKIIFTATLSIALLAAAAFASTAQFDAGMQPILTEYLKIADVLANDSTTGIQKAAAKIEKLADKLDPATVTGEHAGHYQNVPANLKAATKSIMATEDIVKIRKAFSELSKPMAMWAGMAKPAGINVVYCYGYPGSWLQRGAQVKNPYYGGKMLTCGQIISGPDKPEGTEQGHHGMRGDHGRHGLHQ
jgi:uncharacterized protein DUF3347